MKITEKIVNIETGEETFVEREETQSEIDFRLEHQKVLEERQSQIAARQAILDRLGLTEEEARLLLGGN